MMLAFDEDKETGPKRIESRRHIDFIDSVCGGDFFKSPYLELR